MTEPGIQEVYRLETPEQALALLNPLRADMLRILAEPVSASEIGRQLGETPQKVNYHLKALEKVGLARRSGTRQVRNLVEVLYRAVARTYVIPDSFGWAEDTVRRMKEQGTLRHLITAAERIRSDAARLMDASDEGTAIPSAALEAELYVPEEADREAFVRDYAEAMRRLADKYRSDGAKRVFRAVMAVYPEPDKGGSGNEQGSALE